MSLNDAIQLITIPFTGPEIWADLGAGNGTFTQALAHLMTAGSVIHAVDRESAALAQIPEKVRQTAIQKWMADFTVQPLPFGTVDGFLLANSLHFVKDKIPFLQNLEQHLKNPNGRILLVEYDTDTPNPWVPYPLSFYALNNLTEQLGWAKPLKISERPSVYGRANIYTALLVMSDE